MSNPETELDLEKLFLPAWAQESPNVNKYSKHAGDDRPQRDERRGGGSRPPRRDFGGGGGQRPGGPQSRGSGGPGGNRPGQSRDGQRSPQGGGDRFRRDEPREYRPPEPFAEISVTLLPDEKGVESIARQIKMTGRAYPLFEIAKLVLQKPERQQVKFDVIKKPDGTIAQPLFLCALDDSLWLSEDEAVAHVLGKHFATFYQAERTPTDPPKGTYTFVGQCGMSGTILGPPNHHDYQNQLRKLHLDRFSRMQFEEFKSRVKIVKDEAIVKKWIEDQSFKTEFVCLNVADAPRLQTREEVEKHFRETHLANIVKPVDSHTMTGLASRQLRCPPLQRVLREAWEEQRRFPIKLATVLSQLFAHHGLQFFKVNKTITHVSVARPNFLDLETTPVSDAVKKIVEFINANPKCSRRKLIESLAPSVAAPDGQKNDQPSAEQTAIIGDLHWLIHQGHVIEFADGLLETAKKPLPRPEQKPKVRKENLPGSKGAVPNASVEDIEPKVAEMEARPIVPSEDSPAENSDAEKKISTEQQPQEAAIVEVPAEK
ncbi:MAG: hypothetical protein ABI042_15460 [Verrucomicrobiota bacterium]